MENEDILYYHIYQYHNIIRPYIRSMWHASAHARRPQFSLIFSNQEYHIVNGIDNDFFNKTNISYQVIDLIHQLICIKNKEEQQNEDILFSILANEIMKHIKNKI